MTESETLPLLNDNAGTEDGGSNSRANCCGVVRNEFHLENFGFDFQPEEVFYSSQWNVPKAFFVFYRLVLCGYSMTALVLSIVWSSPTPNRPHFPWPAFLTHWSYAVLATHLLMSAVIALLHLRDEGYASLSSGRYSTIVRQKTKLYLKIDWLVFCVASAAAIIVTSTYFIALFPQQGNGHLSVADINLHVMNTVIVVLEFVISAFPVRLLHCVYVMMYGMLYGIFSIIYWSFDHSNVLYPGVLDWNRPGKTVIFTGLLLLVGIPLLQTVFFAIYRFRLFIFKKVYPSSASS